MTAEKLKLDQMNEGDTFSMVHGSTFGDKRLDFVVDRKTSTQIILDILGPMPVTGVRCIIKTGTVVRCVGGSCPVSCVWVTPRAELDAHERAEAYRRDFDLVRKFRWNEADEELIQQVARLIETAS